VTFEIDPDVSKAAAPLLGRHPVETGCKVSRCLDGSLGVGYLLLAGDLLLFGDRKVGRPPEFRAASVRAIESAKVVEEGLDAFGRFRFKGGEALEIPLSLFDMAPFRAFVDEVRDRTEDLASRPEPPRTPQRDARPAAPFTAPGARPKPRPPSTARRSGNQPRVKMGRVSGSRCPHCRRELVWTRTHDVVVEACLTCKGCLLSAAAVAQLGRRPDAGLGQLPPGVTRCRGCSALARPDDSFCGECGSQLGIDCPACRGTQRPVMVGQVEVDLCDSCGAVWLDRGEAKQVADGPQLGTPCVGCSTPLPDPKSAYLSERGPLCERCYRSGEFAEWFHRKAHEEGRASNGAKNWLKYPDDLETEAVGTTGLDLLDELIESLMKGLVDGLD
jgi:Zn-finger nucleic acid-binding protein